MQVSSDYPLTACPHLPIRSKASMLEFLIITAGILITQNILFGIIYLVIINNNLH